MLFLATKLSHVDVTKAYACNPENPTLGTHGTFCWWAEPETGYHISDDVWQIKRDMRYFAMAGIDFIYLDFTNGYIYEKSFRALLDTCLELRAEGQMTPYIVPWALALGALRLAKGYHQIKIEYAHIGGEDPQLSMLGKWVFKI